MYKTYQNFKNLSILCGDMTTNEATIKYQVSRNPVYLAKVFCDMFPYLLEVGKNYFYLLDEDKASIMVEETHRAMMAFDTKRKCKVDTLISTYINRRLYAETSMLNHHKRSINKDAESYEEVCATRHEEYEENEYGKVELERTLEEMNLTDNELACCKIIIEETHKLKNDEIAKELGITPMAITYIKRSLQKKLDPILI